MLQDLIEQQKEKLHQIDFGTGYDCKPIDASIELVELFTTSLALAYQEGRKEAWKELGVEGMKKNENHLKPMGYDELEARVYNQALSDLIAKAKELNLE